MYDAGLSHESIFGRTYMMLVLKGLLTIKDALTGTVFDYIDDNYVNLSILLVQ